MKDCEKKSTLSKSKRRAQALRENLRKRKNQQRIREHLKIETEKAPSQDFSEPLSPETLDQQEESL